MKFKIFVSVFLILTIISAGLVEAAYDLPKIKIEKSKSTAVKKSVLKSDWKDFRQFENKIKLVLAEEKNLSPASPARIFRDKNLVFIGFYKDTAYFLDKYSIKILANDERSKIWKQHIFPVGMQVSSKNSRMTVQTFRIEDGKFYNSAKLKKSFEDIENAGDKNFLSECLKVGCYCAFDEIVD